MLKNSVSYSRLRPHGQVGKGSAKCGQVWTGGSKSLKMCGYPLYMSPIVKLIKFSPFHFAGLKDHVSKICKNVVNERRGVAWYMCRTGY